MKESWSLEQCAGTKQQWAVLREHGAFSPSLHFLLQRLMCEVYCYESYFVIFHCVWDPLLESQHECPWNWCSNCKLQWDQNFD